MRYLSPIYAVVVLLCMACSGNAGEEDLQLVLTADRTSTYVGGEDVIFTVMYGSEDVTASDGTSISWTSGDSGGTLASGTGVFTPGEEGDFTFTASYTSGGISVTSSPVEISVTEQPVFRDYVLHCLAMQFTSVGCVNCPVMSTNLKSVCGEYPDLVHIAAFHTDYSGVSDPMACSETSLFMTRFGVDGLPQCYLDMNPEKVTSDISDIRSGVEEALSGEAVCGVAVESSMDSGSGRVSVTARITSNESAVFRYLILLVEDGIEYMQYGAEDSGSYVHNNVVRDVLSTSSEGERLNLGEALTAGVEYEGTRSADLEDSWDTGNMRVIVAALYSADDGVSYVCANTASCPLGGSTGYDIEE